jgi:hypothetical protein
MIKRYLIPVIALCLIISGCENALTGHGDGGVGNTLSGIRGAVEDPVEGCALQTLHRHDGQRYAGHYNNDGHGHQGLEADTPCVFGDCVETGLHQHNGTYYTGHAANDGCGHHGGHW